MRHCDEHRTHRVMDHWWSKFKRLAHRPGGSLTSYSHMTRMNRAWPLLRKSMFL